MRRIAPIMTRNPIKAGAVLIVQLVIAGIQVVVELIKAAKGKEK